MSNLGWLVPGAKSRGGFLSRGNGDEMASLAKKYGITSMIGKGMRMCGPVVACDSLMVFGEVMGEVRITGQGRMVLIREGGAIGGDVSAETVLIRGDVTGNVSGKTVRLYSSATVRGRIRAEKLVVDEGATILNPAVQVGSSDAIAQAVSKAREVIDGEAFRPPPADVANVTPMPSRSQG